MGDGNESIDLGDSLPLMLYGLSEKDRKRECSNSSKQENDRQLISVCTSQMLFIWWGKSEKPKWRCGNILIKLSVSFTKSEPNKKSLKSPKCHVVNYQPMTKQRSAYEWTVSYNF